MKKRNTEIFPGDNKVYCQHWLEVEEDGYMRPDSMVSLHLSKECLVRYVESKLRRERTSPNFDMPLGGAFLIGVSDQIINEITEYGGTLWYDDTVSDRRSEWTVDDEVISPIDINDMNEGE